MRIEDVDRAREVPGAADSILRTLEAFGLDWDGPVTRQSTRSEFYDAALASLADRHLTYPCSCTRAEIAAAAAAATAAPPPRRREIPAGPAETRYLGRCRQGPTHPRARLAVRLRTDGFAAVTVEDRLQPPLIESVEGVTGDFVLKRRDGFYAYQLAVVVDDAAQGITDVVRGLDLYDNTPRQRVLQLALHVPAPSYLHLPLVVERSGTKLSKTHRSVAADPAQAPALLGAILRWLRHPPPEMLRGSPVEHQLAWAKAHWNPSLLQGVAIISSTE